MISYLLVLFASIIVNNVVFNQVYGICPFLGVSKKPAEAVGMGVAVTFVMTAASAVTWPIRYYVLERFSLGYLETVVFILVIAALVQFLETVLKKFIPTLHKALGIYLPLITTNCAVLGVTVDNISASYSYLASIFAAVGGGLGFLLAMLLFAGVRLKVNKCDCPKSWKGLPITLAAAAIVSLAFKGFEGLVSIPSKAESPELYFENTLAKIETGSLVWDVLIAAGIVMLLGTVAAFLLSVAAKYLTVPVDEKTTQIRACLPGANCGACGFTGCDGYAKALSENADTPTNLCVPGADKVSRDISALLGREFTDVVEMVAVVACAGNCVASPDKNAVVGVKTCAAAKMLYGGPKACVYGCIGFGDCVAVCPQKAICLSDGIAHIDTRKCIGCGLCRDACPQKIITVLPDIERVSVMCSSRGTGAETRRDCKNGCIGCRKCEKNCPTGAITVENNLAKIDYTKCTFCRACTEVCPTGAVGYFNLSGYHRMKEAKTEDSEK